MNEKQFFRACSNGNVKGVSDAIALGIDLDAKDRHGLSGLILAAREGHLQVAEVLLDAGANIEFGDVRGRTALFHAVCFDKKEMVSLLAGRGANLDVIDCHQATPCKIAEAMRNQGLVELLASLGSKSCPSSRQFLRIGVGVDCLNVTSPVVADLAIASGKRIRDKLSQLQLVLLDRSIQYLDVSLRIGTLMPLQPVERKGQTVSAEVGVPELATVTEMDRALSLAVKSAFLAIADFLRRDFGQAIDPGELAKEVAAAVDALAIGD